VFHGQVHGFYALFHDPRHPIFSREGIMSFAKNVAKGEKVVRVILGILLAVLGFFLTGFWRPALIVVGVLFLLTAFVGY
jgi:hypothetical protein